MPPAGHYGDVETAIGRVVVQLCGPDFKYMNGETITLEGGRARGRWASLLFVAVSLLWSPALCGVLSF